MASKKRHSVEVPDWEEPPGDAPATHSEEAEAVSEEAMPELDAIELSEDAIELVQRLEIERDDAVEARQRALADYANFQRRARENERRAREHGTTDVARSLLPVLDQLDLALGQDTESLAVEQLLEGVQLVQQELLKALEAHHISRIDPIVGDLFDPNEHEAMMQQESDDIAPGYITAVFQIGYRIGDLVLRPAKVAVAGAEE